MGIFDEHELLLSEVTGIDDRFQHGHSHEDAILHLRKDP
ncbi:hypothetical protein AAULR_11550 [Lacticaseibacillus rhamnosus MTCC 5462]|nr:hypothetical protein LRH_03498 [Lacticaseibacillus rhamnosus HN001]EGF34121.1 hypothetical protein AAULR_11550 [Lacticaseibacillus rhamnosus MTCC 5462]EHJ24109.1 hypothetical protein R0011_02730 [Lacticaseibacillus rhamnosus R0011]